MKARIKSPYNGPHEWDSIPYTVRYVRLHVSEIYNNIAPPDSQVAESQDWYDKLLSSIEREGIRNPVNLTCVRPLSTAEVEERGGDPDNEANHNWPNVYRYYDIGWGEHLQLMRDSIPEKWRGSDEPLILCHHMGGSRLWAASKLGIEVPAIVSDFCDHFNEGPVIDSRGALRSFFKDPPERIILGRMGPLFGLPHVHLGHKRPEDRYATP